MIVTSTHSILMTNDQPGQRCATRWIVSTAAAAAWLPHSKLRDKRLTSGQDLIQRTMELTMVGSLGAG
ncbi:hypothetical protein [Chloroflexus sp.]|uniref:hypothetical protein n=1 Tax=Chloroflexus sp. TaxID=1904827 RepID=UPI002ADE47A6|nr:hypothetical protein [Chloroflexus sp.]